jgi:putative Mn2+ efflux pump MntP
MAYQRRLGMIGFLIAGIIGLWMIATIFVQDRRSSRRKGKS